MTTPDAELTTVRLLEVPVALRYESVQHGEELLREMTLVSQQAAHGDVEGLPRRLIDFAHEVVTAYGPYTAAQAAELDEALTRGDETLAEVVYQVPAGVAAVAQRLREIFDEADRYCREGRHLLTLATPPAVARYRAWFLGEFVRQTQGEPAVSWPEYDATA